MGAVSADTEYFCPMDPGVLSSWPGRCPICQMATVRRTKGDMGTLPSGVVARVQLSRDQVQLGGIRSEAVRYRPLAGEISSVGPVTVDPDRVSVRVEIGADEAAHIAVGQAADVSIDPPDGTDPVRGRVRSVGPVVVVEVSGPAASLRTARFAAVAIRPPLADREPFRSMPRGEPPDLPGEPRSTFACPGHPQPLRAEAGRCEEDGKPLERSDLARNQRLRWWCPTHPSVVADRSGRACDECGGMPLVTRVVAYCPPGEVLAVPESAVIDTGARTVVYVERMPGVFDGVEVRLGPWSGGYYPVVEGLEAGQAVAGAGAFLVDAETRLNPGLAATYFGAKRPGQDGTRPATKAGPSDLAGLSPEDRSLASEQATCPVSGKPLGSMGTPIRVVARGRTVFLCCAGCSGPIEKLPDKYLARLKPAGGTGHHP